MSEQVVGQDWNGNWWSGLEVNASYYS